MKLRTAIRDVSRDAKQWYRMGHKQKFMTGLLLLSLLFTMTLVVSPNIALYAVLMALFSGAVLGVASFVLYSELTWKL